MTLSTISPTGTVTKKPLLYGKTSKFSSLASVKNILALSFNKFIYPCFSFKKLAFNLGFFIIVANNFIPPFGILDQVVLQENGIASLNSCITSSSVETAICAPILIPYIDKDFDRLNAYINNTFLGKPTNNFLNFFVSSSPLSSYSKYATSLITIILVSFILLKKFIRFTHSS